MKKLRTILAGERYGRQEVLRNRELGTDKLLLVRCDCGTEREMDVYEWGKVQSCGCMRIEQLLARLKKHGMTGSAEYNTWNSMIYRTTNPNSPSWMHYGGRGITVCERWRTFENFYADMGPRPESKSLDRINVNGNYEPGNCRWATAVEQAQNRRPYLASGEPRKPARKPPARWAPQPWYEDSDDASDATLVTAIAAEK